MGNCMQTDQSHSTLLDFSANVDLWLLMGNFIHNATEEEEEEVWLVEDAQPCEYSFCSTFIGGIPAFLAVASTLGILLNVLLGLALAKCPRFRDHPGRTNLFLLAASGLLFAATLPFFALGIHRRWVFDDRLCQAAHGLKFGSLFAQGLLGAGSTCHVPQGPPRSILPAALWIMGFLCSIPAALVSSANGVCVPDRLAERHAWSLVHVLFCLAVFVLLPVAMALALVCLKGQGKSRRPLFNVTWVFYLFWAPYGVALFLDKLQEEASLWPACVFLERLNYLLGLSEGLGALHCCLCPLFVLGLGLGPRRSRQTGKC